MIHPYADYWRSRGRFPIASYCRCGSQCGLLSVFSLPLGEGKHSTQVRYSGHRPSFYSLRAYGCTSSPARVLAPSNSEELPELHHNHPQQRPSNERHTKPCSSPRLFGASPRDGRVEHGNWTCHLLCPSAFAAATGTIMIRMEDAELEHRFGPDYIEYKQEVPAVIPRLLAQQRYNPLWPIAKSQKPAVSLMRFELFIASVTFGQNAARLSLGSSPPSRLSE